jgi:hypothetical protein
LTAKHISGHNKTTQITFSNKNTSFSTNPAPKKPNPKARAFGFARHEKLLVMLLGTCF